MGSAAGAVWGEQSQLDPWGRVGAGCWQQGDLIPALGDAWPGRRSSPLGPGAQEGWAAGSMVFDGAKKGNPLWLWDALHKGHSWV